MSFEDGDVAPTSAQDSDSWRETAYLLRSPENARRLMDAVARDRAGALDEPKGVEELEERTGVGRETR